MHASLLGNTGLDLVPANAAACGPASGRLRGSTRRPVAGAREVPVLVPISMSTLRVLIPNNLIWIFGVLCFQSLLENIPFNFSFKMKMLNHSVVSRTLSYFFHFHCSSCRYSKSSQLNWSLVFKSQYIKRTLGGAWELLSISRFISEEDRVRVCIDLFLLQLPRPSTILLWIAFFL